MHANSLVGVRIRSDGHHHFAGCFNCCVDVLGSLSQEDRDGEVSSSFWKICRWCSSCSCTELIPWSWPWWLTLSMRVYSQREFLSTLIDDLKTKSSSVLGIAMTVSVRDFRPNRFLQKISYSWPVYSFTWLYDPGGNFLADDQMLVHNILGRSRVPPLTFVPQAMLTQCLLCKSIWCVIMSLISHPPLLGWTVGTSSVTRQAPTTKMTHLTSLLFELRHQRKYQATVLNTENLMPLSLCTVRPNQTVHGEILAIVQG
jgi:hypothetical protein